LTAVAEGPRTPHLEDLIPGFDEGAHATALGKSLLATLPAEQRARYLKDFGMRPFTPHTVTTPEAFEADIAAGERRQMQLEVNQYRQGLACAAMVAVADRDPEKRVVIACAVPAPELMTSAKVIRTRLTACARGIATAYGEEPC
jgi:DNA-binding IclR family transcriptional regulator